MEGIKKAVNEFLLDEKEKQEAIENANVNKLYNLEEILNIEYIWIPTVEKAFIFSLAKKEKQADHGRSIAITLIILTDGFMEWFRAWMES